MEDSENMVELIEERDIDGDVNIDDSNVSVDSDTMMKKRKFLQTSISSFVDHHGTKKIKSSSDESDSQSKNYKLSPTKKLNSKEFIIHKNNAGSVKEYTVGDDNYFHCKFCKFQSLKGLELASHLSQHNKPLVNVKPLDRDTNFSDISVEGKQISLKLPLGWSRVTLMRKGGSKVRFDRYYVTDNGKYDRASTTNIIVGRLLKEQKIGRHLTNYQAEHVNNLQTNDDSNTSYDREQSLESMSEESSVDTSLLEQSLVEISDIGSVIETLQLDECSGDFIDINGDLNISGPNIENNHDNEDMADLEHNDNCVQIELKTNDNENCETPYHEGVIPSNYSKTEAHVDKQNDAKISKSKTKSMVRDIKEENFTNDGNKLQTLDKVALERQHQPDDFVDSVDTFNKIDPVVEVDTLSTIHTVHTVAKVDTVEPVVDESLLNSNENNNTNQNEDNNCLVNNCIGVNSNEDTNNIYCAEVKSKRDRKKSLKAKESWICEEFKRQNLNDQSVNSDEDLTKGLHIQNKTNSDEQNTLCDKSSAMNLPTGWKRVKFTPRNGGSAGYYFLTDAGKKLRSQKEVDKYFVDNKLDLEVIFGDPCSTLPIGWEIVKFNRKISSSSTCYYYLTDTGEKLRSQKEVDTYLAKRKLDLKVIFEDSVDVEHEGSVEEVRIEEVSHCNTDDIINKRGRGRPKGDKNKATSKKHRSTDSGNTDDSNQNSGETDANSTVAEEVEDEVPLTQNEMDYLEEIKTFLSQTSLRLEPSPPTKGDGNCWYRAAAEQVILHDIPNKPREHKSMRLAVCDHVKRLPEQVKEDTTNVVYFGKRQGITNLACRQRKGGQWVDNTGVMVLTTAHYLSRNINLYGYGPPDGVREYALTTIEGGEEADNYPPLTIFYYDKHYQTLQPVVVTDVDRSVVSDLIMPVVSGIDETVGSGVEETVVSGVKEPVVSGVEGSVVSGAKEPVVSEVEGPMVSGVEVPVVSEVKESMVSEVEESIVSVEK